MTKFDFDEMMNLFQNDPAAFEKKRLEMIEETIAAAPESQHDSLRKLQYDLDQIRTKQPKHFMYACFNEIKTNLESLNSAWNKITNMSQSMKDELIALDFK
jgi:hypothetical protein